MTFGAVLSKAIHTEPARQICPSVEKNLLFGYPELVGSPFTYRREEEIFGEGEDADYVYRIDSGAVRSCKILPDGRRQINAFHIPGDLFGLEGGPTHRLTAEAVSDTTVVLFRRRQLETLAARDASIAFRLWTMTAKELRQAEDQMIRLGRRSAVERVAAFLVEMDRRFGGTGRIQLPMSRRDIADYLGLTLETVSRSLSQLQSKQALTLSCARLVQLNNRIIAPFVED